MKNKKMNLSELKVKSFVTDLEKEKENTVKGGRNSEGYHESNGPFSECCTAGVGVCDAETWFGKGCVKM